MCACVRVGAHVCVCAVAVSGLCAGVLDIIPEQCGHVVLKATQPAGGVEGMCADELKFCDLALGEEKVRRGGALKRTHPL